MGAGPQVTFTTDFFKPAPGEDEEISPGHYGKELAAKLKERGAQLVRGGRRRRRSTTAHGLLSHAPRE